VGSWKQRAAQLSSAHIEFPFLNEKPHMVDGSRNGSALLFRARTPVTAWPQPSGEVKASSSQAVPHTGLPAGLCSRLLGPCAPAAKSGPGWKAEARRGSQIYQAVGKGVSSLTPRKASRPPCAPFDLCTRKREREGKDSGRHSRHHPGYCSPAHTWGCLFPFVHEIQ